MDIHADTCAEFKPVTITYETLDRLTKEDKSESLIALYMHYVAITQWQNTNNIKASTSFMKKRLGWGDKKFAESKKKLNEMGLITDVRKTDAENKVVGWFIRVMYVVKYPPSGSSEGVGLEGTSTINLKESTINSKEDNTFSQNRLERTSSIGDTGDSPKESFAIPSEDDFRFITSVLGESKRVKYLDDRKRMFVSRLKSFSMQDIKKAAINLSSSSFHMGENDQKTKYADFDFLMRSDKQVDKWLNKTPVQTKKSAF